jgi:hypothetical protein
MQSSIQTAGVEQHPFFGNHEESKRRERCNALKNHLLAASSEFLGTVLFLWFAFAGTQVAAMSSAGTGGPNDEINNTDPQRLLYISLSFGMSLLVVAWAFYRISGGLFNPAVSHHGSLHIRYGLIYYIGHNWFNPCGCIALGPLHISRTGSTYCWHRGGSSGFLHASWSHVCVSDKT